MKKVFVSTAVVLFVVFGFAPCLAFGQPGTLSVSTICPNALGVGFSESVQKSSMDFRNRCIAMDQARPVFLKQKSDAEVMLRDILADPKISEIELSNAIHSYLGSTYDIYTGVRLREILESVTNLYADQLSENKQEPSSEFTSWRLAANEKIHKYDDEFKVDEELYGYAEARLNSKPLVKTRALKLDPIA